MIKRILFSLLLCAGASSVWADGPARAALDAMVSKLAGYKTYEVQFTADMGSFGDFDGRMVVSGDKYYIDVNDYEVFFDGGMRWTYNDNDDEVVIENPDPADNNLLSNPSRFFKLSAEDFDSEHKGASDVAGRKVERIELKPRKSVGQSIILRVDASTKLPVGVTYIEGGASTDITINKITPNVAVSGATFSFDKGKYPGVEVIDFR